MGIDRTNVGITWVEDGVGHAGVMTARQTPCLHKMIDFGSVAGSAVRTRFDAWCAAAGTSRSAFDTLLASDLTSGEASVWASLGTDAQDDAYEAYRRQSVAGWTFA